MKLWELKLVFCKSFLAQVRNLRWLGFRVPLANVNKAHQANQLYPFAISLMESVQSYDKTLKKVMYYDKK